MPSFIDDGYERDDGYIAAAPIEKNGERLWDALEFSYRVATRNEVVLHDAEADKIRLDVLSDPQSAVKSEKHACEFICKRLTKWNLKNSKGQPVEISVPNLGRINGGLFMPLYLIVRNGRVSDPKPPSTESPISNDELEKNS